MLLAVDCTILILSSSPSTTVKVFAVVLYKAPAEVAAIVNVMAVATPFFISVIAIDPVIIPEVLKKSLLTVHATTEVLRAVSFVVVVPVPILI